MSDVLDRALDELQKRTVAAPVAISKDDIVAEMIRNQRTVGLDQDKKLNQSDMARIAKHVSCSLFDPEHCSVWNGYITNYNNPNKGTYINFYFRKHKVALHRLLYYNFIGTLGMTEYLKFRCDYKGYCCSINCLSKHRYFTTNNVPNTGPSVPSFPSNTFPLNGTFVSNNTFAPNGTLDLAFNQVSSLPMSAQMSAQMTGAISSPPTPPTPPACNTHNPSGGLQPLIASAAMSHKRVRNNSLQSHKIVNSINPGHLLIHFG